MSEIKTLEDMRNTVKTIAADCDEGWILGCLDAIEGEIAERFMELPLDADGVPIHVGDTIASDCEIPTEVTLIEMAMAKGEEPAWVLSWGDPMQYGDEDNDWGRFPDQPSSYCHVKPRTLEDIVIEYRLKAYNLYADSEMSGEERVEEFKTLDAEIAAEIRELLGVGE